MPDIPLPLSLPAPVVLNLNVDNYDLEVYSGSGQIGSVPVDGNLNGRDLAYITLTGTCVERPTQTVGFYLRFFPTGSNLQAPSWTAISSSMIRVDLEMDICQLAGVVGILKELPKCQVYYRETISPNDQIVKRAGITTTRAARRRNA